MEIQHTLYINLEERTDRRSHVEEQLASIGIHQPIRFNAVKTDNGDIGCSTSHVRCLELAKKNNWSHVLIVEDDITFVDPFMFKRQLAGFFKMKSHLMFKSISRTRSAKNMNPPFSKQIITTSFMSG